MRILTNRKGLTPVVATVILCGVVLVIGTSVWSLVYSITSGLQDDYYEGVKRQIDVISERFTVEHVAYVNVTKTVHVWVYNCGNVSINVDIYVLMNGATNGSDTQGTSVTSGELVERSILLGDFLSSGAELVVEVITRRQNVVYQTYVIPSPRS